MCSITHRFVYIVRKLKKRITALMRGSVFMHLFLMIVYCLHSQHFSPLVIVEVLLCTIACVLNTTVQEFEYLRLFNHQKENSLEGENGTGASGNKSFPVVGDVAFALSTMDSTIGQIYLQLERDGQQPTIEYGDGQLSFLSTHSYSTTYHIIWQLRPLYSLHWILNVSRTASMESTHGLPSREQAHMQSRSCSHTERREYQ